MSYTLVSVFCVVGLIAACNADGFEFTCPEGNASLFPPVVSASQYSYKVTVSIKSKNLTVDAYEMYDMTSDATNGTITMFVHYPDQSNMSIWISDWIKYDYHYNQSLTVNMNSKSCSVGDLEKNETISIFGMGIEDGFHNVKYPFYWTGMYNYTYDNESDVNVNGIPAEKYSTCLLFNNNLIKYHVDLYFSPEQWNSQSGGNTPLKLVLKVNKTENGTHFTDEEYTYLFTSYKHDMTSGWNPGSGNMLWDVVCEGRKDARPLPEVWSNYALIEELYDMDKKKIQTVKKYFNYDARLARADFIASKNSTYGKSLKNHHYTMIQDFYAGVEYLMDKETGSCTISPLHYSMVLPDVEPDPKHPGYLRMRNDAQFIKDRNFTYTGRHKHGNLTVDSWTSTAPFKFKYGPAQLELNETLIYTTPDWSNSDVSPVLLRSIIRISSTINGNTTFQSYTFHVSGSTPIAHGYHSFDVGQCYNNDKEKSFVLKFDASFAEYIDSYSGVMNTAIQSAVAEAAKVRSIRVGSWSGKEVAPDNEGKNSGQESLFVTVYLYDHPLNHTNTTEYKKGINLTEAVNNLRAAVEANKLLITFNTSGGKPIHMTAFSSYFKERSELYSPPAPSPPGPAASHDLTKGAIAGIAISMLVVGIIVGAVFSHYRNKRGNRQFGYSLQD